MDFGSRGPSKRGPSTSGKRLFNPSDEALSQAANLGNVSPSGANASTRVVQLVRKRLSYPQNDPPMPIDKLASSHTQGKRPAEVLTAGKTQASQQLSSPTFDHSRMVRQPETRPISQEQLVEEVKGIYAGLVMVEGKCIQVDLKQAQLAKEAPPRSPPALNSDQYQELIALHRTLLHEHHDFFLASQHPSARTALSRVLQLREQLLPEQLLRERLLREQLAVLQKPAPRGRPQQPVLLLRRLSNERPRSHANSSVFRRKAVKIIFNGKECHARPDSGSGTDICSEEFAMQQGLTISRNQEDIVSFELGDGNIIQSIGRVLVRCGLPSDWGSQESRWFCVLKKCVVPVIMGGQFLKKIKLYTKNKSLLVKCPAWFGDMPTLKYLGACKHWITFSAKGHTIEACADTGSDLDFMSLECARNRQLNIDYRSRRQIGLPDQSTGETVGRVCTFVKVGAFAEFEMEFHILPHLPCDAIFGEESLEKLDAFNTCVETMDDYKDSYEDQPWYHPLNTLVDLGPIAAYLNRLWRRSAPNDTPQQEHDKYVEAEIHLRNKHNKSIRRISDESERRVAEVAENLRRQTFDRGHDNCIHCVGGVA